MTEGIGPRPIAVSLLTGFLGSGKTTLLNHLLTHPEMDRTAVLINEFGAVGLDHLLVRQLDDDVVLLKSGCICCTVQGELVDGLRELYYRRVSGELPAFDRIVIETTGLADPLPILTCLMRDPLFRHAMRIDTLITTVDAIHGGGQLEEHAEARHQAAVADHLLLTKTDLATGEAAEALVRRLQEINPRARIHQVRFGHASPRDLLGGLERFALAQDLSRWFAATEQQSVFDTSPGATRKFHGHVPGGGIDVNRHDERIRSFSLVLDEPVDRQVFEAWYEDFAEKRGDCILRVKGIVNFTGSDQPYAIHCVQSTWHEPALLPAWPDLDHRSKVVFIVRELEMSAVEASLRAAMCQSAGRGGANSRSTGVTTFGRRWLNAAEMGRLLGGLCNEIDKPAANALRLALLAGIEPIDVAAARWEDIDPKRGTWLVGSPKLSVARGRRSVPLGEPIVLLLRSLGLGAASKGIVFPELQQDDSIRRLDAALRAAAGKAGLGEMGLGTLQPSRGSDTLRGLPSKVVSALLGLSRST